jgi:diguanylate cyclase (GGDEF)-like protein
MLRYRVRHDLRLTLLYLDVDRFGAITRAFGQDGGDAVLRQVCAEITGLLRASDLFGRVGADGFAALLMRSSPEEIAQKAQQLVVRLNGTPAVHLGRPIAFTVTLSLQDCGGFDSVEAIIETAQAEVLSKRTGVSVIEIMTGLLGS